MGALLTASLSASGVNVIAIDLSRCEVLPPRCKFIMADARQCGAECEQAIKAADCVAVCLPEDAALRGATAILERMPDGALWLDTLSIKQGISRIIDSHTPRLEILSINPMFAPGLGWLGNPVAAISPRTGPKTAYMINLLASWGARVVLVSPEEHDDLTASIQVATHASMLAFGLTLLSLDYGVESALRIATPPHRVLLSLLHRLATMNPEVYWDIQHNHPRGDAVRQALRHSLEMVAASAGSESSAGFNEIFADLVRCLGAKESELADLDRRMMLALADPSNNT